MFKKILALLLVLCMLLCVSACGIKDTVSDISSDITTTKITQSQTEETINSTESKVSTPTTTPSQTQSAVQPTPQPVPQPQHTHSYITTVKSATCTEQGYTTYTCSCGNTYNADFVTPSHKYTNYKCSVCGAIDKEHTFDYLVNWITKNGKIEGSEIKLIYTYDDIEYNIVYTAQNDTFLFTASSVRDGDFYFIGISNNESSDECVYSFRCTDLESQTNNFMFSGIIKKSTYTFDSPITYVDFSSDIGLKVDNQLLEIPRVHINTLMIGIECILCGAFDGAFGDSGITLADLGFDLIEY